MTAHRIVIPSIDEDATYRCVRSLRPAYRSRVIEIDNTETNRGVPASWNLGIRQALDDGAEFVTLCSASIRFEGGQNGLDDGGQKLCETADFAAAHNQWPYGFESMNGWHLFTIGRRTFAEVGPFDEQFFPAYYEDTDYIWRMRCAGILPPAGPHTPDRKIPWVPGLLYWSLGDGMAIKSGKVTVDLAKNAAYYERKWGGPPGEERWPIPFGYGDDFSYPVHAHG